MASKRIDELTTRAVANTDLLPPTPSGGPSGSATVAAVVAAGLSQPNSASAGAGASITIKAADGVTSGAGGSIILQPGAQATTGGNGVITVRQPGGVAGTDEISISHDGTNGIIKNLDSGGDIKVLTASSKGMNFVSSSNSDVYLRIRNDGYISVGNIELNLSTGGSTPITLSCPNSWVRCQAGLLLTDASFNIDLLLQRASVGIMRVSNASTSGGSLAYTNATTAVSANQNNLILNGSAFQRLNCSVASDITGIAPPISGAHVDGRMIRIVNVGTATLTLKHNSTSSSAANRMFCASGADYALAANAKAELVYDSTDNGSGAPGWRVYQ